MKIPVTLLEDAELGEIEVRNKKRQELHAYVTQGSWVYDSFAFVEATDVPYAQRVAALVRRREWFDKLIKRYGGKVLDEGSTEGPRHYALQPAHDAMYSAAVCSEDVEADIERLISEVRRLRRELGSR